MLPTVRQSSIHGFDPHGRLTTRRYMLPGEQELLLALIDGVRARTMIEFGVNEGITAAAVLANAPTIERYIGVDVDGDYRFEIPAQSVERPTEPGWRAKADRRFELVTRPRGSKDLNVSDLPRADFIFIDGDHGYESVKHDSILASNLVRSGGIIAWHDYNNQTVSVTRALNELCDAGWDIRSIEHTWLAFEAFQ